MRKRLAVTTIQDIMRVLGHAGPDVDFGIDEDGEEDYLVAEASPITVKMKPAVTMFHWKVEALDDPGDKDEGYSSDPTRDIVEFLQGDIPGSQFLDKYASRILRRVASRVAFRARTGSALVDLHNRKIDQLIGQMAKKGWRADKFTDDSGLPAIQFEIGERYSGTVMLHDVAYDYEFSVDGEPNLTESGTANDMENRLIAWMRSPEVRPIVEPRKWA